MTEAVADRNLLSLKAMVEAVRFGDTEISILGGPTIAVSDPIPAPEQERLEGHVADALYNLLYLNPRSSQGLGFKRFMDSGLKTRFSQALHTANSSRFSWLPYCVFAKREGELVEVDTGEGLTQVHSLYFEGPDMNGMGKVLMENRKSPEDPNWYYAFGEQGLNAKRQPLLRVYWAISPQGAPALMRRLTTSLNTQMVPFQLKGLKDPMEYGRSDAFVLYLSAPTWRRVVPSLVDIAAKSAPHLQDTTPLLARRIAKGVAFAEDPGEGKSFGKHRMTLVARLLCEAGGKARMEPESATNWVVDQLAGMGYPLGRLHLNPATAWDYPVENREELLRRAFG